jgi:hypothetical protein
MAFLSKKYSLKVDDLMNDMTEFKKVHDERGKASDLEEKYQVFLMKHEKELDTEYTEKNEFRTNVRGIEGASCVCKSGGGSDVYQGSSAQVPS